MNKIKEFFKKVWDTMNDPRYEKPLLVALPCLALLLSAMILMPRIRQITAMQAARSMETPAVAAEPAPIAVTPAPTPKPTPTATPKPEGGIKTSLNAVSVDKDIYITVCGEDGRPISGQVFTLQVKYPDGQVYDFETEQDGSCYLVRLSAGDYTISMKELDDYDEPEPIVCSVKEYAQYVPIRNIEAVADVRDVSQVSQSEVKPASNYEAPTEMVAEEINTKEQEELASVIVINDRPAEEQTQPTTLQGSETEQTGKPAFTYTYNVGPNGYLLYKDSQEESNVIPVDEDNDGVPEYGLAYVTQETAETPSQPSPAPAEDPGPILVIGEDAGNEEETEQPADGETVTEPEPPAEPETPPAEPETPAQPETPVQPQTVSVELFNPDGTPTGVYDITATPVTEEDTENEVGWRVIEGKTYYYYADGSKAIGLKKIDGKLYYFNEFGVKASSVGIDVSFYNEDIDWPTVRAQGVDFAIIRVGGRGWTSGVLYDDTRTQEYLRGARAAGLRVGVYFYSTAINTYEAVEEASVAVSKLNGISLDFPIFIDMEFSGQYPYGRSDNLSPSERANIAIAFCETVSNAGYRAGVYSGQNFFKYSMDYGAVSRYYIWLASYTSNDRLPNFSNRYDMWQFSDRGRMEGINGNVDMDVIF